MKGLRIYDLNTKETVGQIIEKFKNKDRDKMWSDCFNFIDVWKNRVRNFGYTYFAEMEFNMDFLFDIENKIEEIKNADQLELFPE